MKLSQLVKKVGDENFILQPLAESMTNISTSKKGISKVTFETNQITANEFLRGGEKIGLVVWFDKEKLERPKKYQFAVTNGRAGYSGTYDPAKDQDILEGYSKEELRDLECSADKVAEFNGKHIIFGLWEAFQQSGNNLFNGVEEKDLTISWTEI